MLPRRFVNTSRVSFLVGPHVRHRHPSPPVFTAVYRQPRGTVALSREKLTMYHSWFRFSYLLVDEERLWVTFLWFLKKWQSFLFWNIIVNSLSRKPQVELGLLVILYVCTYLLGRGMRMFQSQFSDVRENCGFFFQFLKAVANYRESLLILCDAKSTF